MRAPSSNLHGIPQEIRRDRRQGAPRTSWIKAFAIVAGGGAAVTAIRSAKQLRAYFGPATHAESPDLPELAASPLRESRQMSDGRSHLLLSPADAHVALPLIVVIHGDDGSADSMRTFTGFERAANGRVHVAYAQADGPYWGQRTGGTNAELAYFDAVVQDASRARTVDPNRIFVFGWSSGAWLAQAYACSRKEVRGVALSGAKSLTNCGKSKPTLVLHGTEDHEHPIRFGDALVAELRTRNACSATSTATLVQPCVQYDKCTQLTAYCRVEHSAHYPWKSAARASWMFFNSL